jgi:molybdopterin synthase catalytic subunit
MFKIIQNRIEASNLPKDFLSPRAGALVTFEGIVRNHNEGKQVLHLEYECFETMAVKEGEKVLREAKEKFEILETRCVHRVGSLAIGEIAVWIGVTAEHRHPAFQACEYIMDQVKARVPIWKKEIYADGNKTWIGTS